MKMKVAILSLKRFEDENAGQGIPRVINEIYKRMVALKPIDIQVEKIIMPDLKYDALSFQLGSQITNMSGYDIIHNTVGFLKVKKGRAKLVVTMYDLNPFGRTGKWKLWYKMFFKPGVMYSIKKADHIIAISTQTEKELVEFGCDKKKITVASLGISEKFITTKRRVKRDKKFRIGYIGSFEPNKNVDFLVNSVSLINDEEVVAELWGRAPESYKNFVEARMGRAQIVLKGFAPDNKLVDIYDSFDVFVFPSLYEGFGLPILEAQARGLPVILCRESKIPAEVKKHCLEAENERELARFIQDLKKKGYSKKDRETAMKYSKSFTWEKTAEKTISVYKKVMG